MLTTPAIELAQLAVVWGLPLQGDPGGSLSSISGAAPLVLHDLLHRTLLAFVTHAYPHHWYGTVCVADLLHRRHVPFKTHGVLDSGGANGPTAAVTEVGAATGAPIRVISGPQYGFAFQVVIAVASSHLFVASGSSGGTVTELPA